MNGSVGDAPPSVAVIGMAGRFPGAGNVREFWDNLRRGEESIRFFSEAEMVDAGVDPAELRSPNYVPARGVARDLDLFDASFFGYTPREAELMDPQHRVFLECAWEALEDSGILPDSFPGAIGVYGGSSISTYLINNVAPVLGGLGAGAIQAALANDKDHVPTRVAYKLNLRGPAVNVQTACSTSLVATHLACQSLLSGECDVALAGGASVTVPLKAGYRFEDGSILSPDGHCRAFDADAAGTVGGSGVAIVVLKRLEDAIDDGDTIHAVIRGSAINNDGSLKVGYTAPSVEGQAEVVAQAQGVAEVDPETITYIESHGTATQLGDPIEISALTQAFRERTDRSGFCAIGSVKTNVGHMDAAAGVTGLIKTVLALEHAEIPPSLHFQAPNPQIDFDRTPFYVNRELAPWQTDGMPRRAGVSSFGIGGTNAHVVLEEPPARDPTSPSRERQLLVLSARTGTALRAAAERLADHLEAEGSATDLADAAYTLQTGRRAFPLRQTVIARDPVEAVGHLRRVAGDLRERTSAIAGRPVLFLFPGQGSQHVGMGRSLYEAEPTFREHMDECFEILEPLLGSDLRSIVYPEDPSSPEAQARLTDTRFAQPALFAIQYSLSRLWDEWGIRPDGMIGHSIGEYTAACVGGVFDLPGALRIVTARGRLMAEQPPGSMLALPLPAEEVQSLGIDGVSLAAVNQHGLSVVSGPSDAIERLAGTLKRRGVEGRLLHTSHAFHSSMMEPAMSPFADEISKVELHAPRIPFVSCVTGGMIRPQDATDPAYWARHIRDPVLFADGLDHLLALHEDALLIEVGPSQTLTALSRRHPTNPVVVPTLPHARSDDDALEGALGALGQAWSSGAEVDWGGFYKQERRRRVSLPTYPFQRERYWMAATAGRQLERKTRGRIPQPEEWLYVPAWKEAPPPRAHMEGLPGSWLILGAETGLGSALSELLGRHGRAVYAVRAGEAFGGSAEDGFAVDPADPSSYDRLLRSIASQGRGLPDVVVHLWCSEDDDDIAASDDARDDDWASLRQVAHLCSALARHGLDRPMRLGAVVSTSVDGPDGSPPRAGRAAILGALRVAPQEIDGLTSVCVDVPGFDTSRWDDRHLGRLLSELAAPEPDAPLVALRGRHRFIESFERLELSEPGPPSLLREGGTYLVLGGLGGTGLEVAHHLHAICGARIALTTRRAVHRDEDGLWRGSDQDEPAFARVRQLQREGADILVLTADVTGSHHTERALSETEDAFGHVHGVFFCAGALKDPTPLTELTDADLEGQLDLRVRGLRALAEATDGRSLDFCLLQSSLASVLGAAGFVAYAAAHRFMDAFGAAQSQKPGPLWLVANWDNWLTWKDAGSGIEGTAEFYMTPDEGRRAFELLLASLDDNPHVVLSTGDLPARMDRWINPSSRAGQSEQETASSSRYSRPETGTPYAPPGNEREERLTEIWGEVLGISKVGIHDDFFELGGDSVLGIQVVAKARKVGIRLNAQQIFDAPTVAEMAKLGAREGAPTPDADQGAVTGEVPLTPIQSWFFSREVPDRHHFNMPLLLEAEEIEASRLETALRVLLAHHDELRASFERSEDGWSQFIGLPDVPVRLVVEDLSEVPDDALGEAIVTAGTLHQQSFDLHHEPLFAAVLFRTGPARPDRVLLVAHHLIVDAVSWRVLLEDLEHAYRHSADDLQIQLPAKTTSYKAWAEALVEYAATDHLRSQTTLWQRHAGHSVPPLPTDGEGGLNTIGDAKQVGGALTEKETRQLLQSAPTALSASIDEVLLAALTAALTGWTRQPEIRIDLEGHGRVDLGPEIDVSRTVGWFTSLYPVLFVVDEPGSSYGALEAVKLAYREIDDGGIGFNLLRARDAGEPAIPLTDSPGAEVGFLYLGRYEDRADRDRTFTVVRDEAGPTCSPEFERPHLLDVLAMVVDGVFRIEVTFGTHFHDVATVQGVIDSFLGALRELITQASETGDTKPETVTFPDAGLTRDQLDAVIARMRDKED